MKSQASKSPKDGAQRKREYDARQRAMGRKSRAYWTTDDEARVLKETLTRLRASK